MHPSIALAALAALFTLASASADEYPLPIESDIKAEYFVVEKAGTAERPTLLLRRVRHGATSYSLRHFDCAGQSYKQVSSGESVEALTPPPVDDDLAPAEEGTIAYQLWKHACGK